MKYLQKRNYASAEELQRSEIFIENNEYPVCKSSSGAKYMPLRWSLTIKFGFQKRKSLAPQSLRTVSLFKNLEPQNLSSSEPQKKHLQIVLSFHTFALFLKLLFVITKGGGIDPMKPQQPFTIKKVLNSTFYCKHSVFKIDNTNTFSYFSKLFQTTYK